MTLAAKPGGDFTDGPQYTSTVFNQQINTVYTWGQGEVDAHIAKTDTAHGITGPFASTTDAQTLTNKTLTSPAVNAGTKTGGTDDGVTFSSCKLDQEAMAAGATTAAGKHSVMVTTSGITVTLKSSMNVDGTRITVTDTTGDEDITIDTEGAENISGQASVQIVEPYGSITVEAYNSHWFIV